MAVNILSIAANLALDEADFLWGVQDQVKLVSNKINLMRSALLDASEKRRNTREVEEWLNQVRDVVMDVEDVIDLFIYGEKRRRQRNIRTRYICYPISLFNLHRLGKKIENFNKEIEQLSAARSTLGLATLEVGQSSNEAAGLLSPFRRRDEQDLPFRERDSVEEFSVIGLEKEEKEVVNKLLTPKESARPSPTVVSIVGMGGSGKTTLARKVYKNKDVSQHFQTRAWVSVSQQCIVKDILHIILEQIKPLTAEEKQQKLNEGLLIERLSGVLRETTYLIVFDDLWSTRHWNKLKQALPVQEGGYQSSSRVLVTTRNEDVAMHADPSTDIHRQHLLTEEESWKLFLSKMMMEPHDYLAGLEDLGRKIVKKCGGLPLAIVVLGGLLSTKPKSHAAWSKVLASVNWELDHNETAGMSCKQVLGLSYSDLPYQLKPCFLYVGLFPEDHEMECSRLLRLWVAEGFIQPRDQLTMEDVAEDYMEELIRRSMIQATVRSYDGRATFCHVHDLVRDLAISEGKQDRFLDLFIGRSITRVSSPNKSRRLSIINEANRHEAAGTHGGSITSNNSNSDAQDQVATPINHLRSLLCFSNPDANLERNIWTKLRLVRVLDLEGLKKAPAGRLLMHRVGKLVLLKYLSLRKTMIGQLPSSMGDLQNLQTLDLRGTQLRHLPRKIMELPQLRNLCIVTPFGSLSISSFDFYPYHNLMDLMDLQILMLHQGNWIGKLHRLTNLRELSIVLDPFEGLLSRYTESLLNAIPKLNRLRSLRFVRLWSFETYNEVFTPILPVSFTSHTELYHMVLTRVIGIRDFPQISPPCY